jgi:serine-type D-Ala-D-Ala carboxypeptidase/endopeptidase
VRHDHQSGLRPTGNSVGRGLWLAGLVSLCALAAGSPVPARAQPVPAAVKEAVQPVSDEEIARMIRFRIEKQRRATGIVVGVLRPSGRSLVAYGATDLKGSRQVGGDTIFEIASLTKIFTALLLADAAVRGEAAIDDPLSAYVPPGVTVPAYEGRPITLADLATHGSGLPLRPNNLQAKPDEPNKYAGYSLDQLYAGLPDYRLTRPPGSKFEYSNVAFGFLGQSLALRRRTSYADLLRTRISAPLGMADTRLDLDPATRPRLVQGHDIDLKPVETSDDGALGPAGGLRSTANDLLRLLGVFLDEGSDGLAPAARLMLTVDRPGQEEHTRMALGWRRTVVDGETLYWSNGSGDGSRAFMGFNPARKIAVVALANASSGEGVDDIGRRVLDPASPVNLKIPSVHHEIVLPARALDRFLGTYQYAPDDRITITRGATGLILSTGSGQLVIYPEAADLFFTKGVEARIEFDRAKSGPSPILVLHQDGQSFTYKRVP